MFDSSDSTAQKPQKPMGVHADRAATVETARPVPYLCGKQRVGVTFISAVFDKSTEAVTQEMGKSSATTGYNYFASFAALVCVGAVDEISDVFLNGDSVYNSETEVSAQSLTYDKTTKLATFKTKSAHGLTTGQSVFISGAKQNAYNGTVAVTVVDANTFTYPTLEEPEAYTATSETGYQITFAVKLPTIKRADHPVYADVTLPGYGTMRIYWGTDTQPADEYLNSTTVKHPPYRGLCYLVFKKLFLGFNQTNVQNIEVVVGRYPRGNAAVHEDCDAPTFVRDLLQDKRAGLALPDSMFDGDAFDATHERLSDENFGFSPLLTRQQETAQTLVQACEYFDGFPVVNRDGTLGLDLNRTDAGETKHYLRKASFSARPTFTQNDWSKTPNEVVVKFTDRSLAYKENATTPWRNVAAKAMTGEPIQLSIDRTWLTHPDIAAAFAKYNGLISTLPAVTGRLTLRQRNGDPVDPAEVYDVGIGGVFYFDDYDDRLTGLRFRVTSRNIGDPSDPKIRLDFTRDYSAVFPTSIATPSDAPRAISKTSLKSTSTPVADEPVSVKVMELPLALCEGGKLCLTALIARPIARSSGYLVWLKRDYDWQGDPVESFENIGSVNRYAQFGKLAEDYPADTFTIDTERGMVVQLEGADQTLDEQSPFTALCDELLVFCGSEVMSVAGVELVAAGQYRLKLVRGRFATPVEAHTTGAECFIMLRSQLPVLSHPHFQPFNTATFKLTLNVPGVSDALATASEFAHDITGFFYAQIPPANLQVNGATRNATRTAGAGVSVSWTPTNIGGNYAADDFVYQRVKLEVFNDADTLVGEKIFKGTPSTLSLTDLTTFGIGGGNFSVRAKRLTRRSEFNLESVATPKVKVTTI